MRPECTKATWNVGGRGRVVNILLVAGDLLELQTVSRLQRSVPLIKMAALEGGLYGIITF